MGWLIRFGYWSTSSPFFFLVFVFTFILFYTIFFFHFFHFFHYFFVTFALSGLFSSSVSLVIFLLHGVTKSTGFIVLGFLGG